MLLRWPKNKFYKLRWWSNIRVAAGYHEPLGLKGR